jgi:hypothetical protein
VDRNNKELMVKNGLKAWLMFENRNKEFLATKIEIVPKVVPL